MTSAKLTARADALRVGDYISLNGGPALVTERMTDDTGQRVAVSAIVEEGPCWTTTVGAAFMFKCYAFASVRPGHLGGPAIATRASALEADDRIEYEGDVICLDGFVTLDEYTMKLSGYVVESQRPERAANAVRRAITTGRNALFMKLAPAASDDEFRGL
jgi:hypothetical protein